MVVDINALTSTSKSKGIDGMVDPPKLLREWEVAEILRGSTSKVKRLRLSGQLAYIPGRPVLIDEADVIAYLEGVKRREREKLGPEPGSPEAKLQARKEAEQRARKIWTLHRLRQKMRTDKS
jgi:Helix-turn-helix domain